MWRRRSSFGGVLLAFAAGCAPAAQPSSSQRPAPSVIVLPPIATVVDAGNVQDAAIARAEAGAPKEVRLTTGSGCAGPSRDAPVAAPGACVVRGARAHVHHVRTRLPGERFLELGVYGGDVSVTIPGVESAPVAVTVHAPFAFDGTTSLDGGNVSIALAQAESVTGALRLAKGAPLRGVAVGDRLHARSPFGDDFDVGPFDLLCTTLTLDDRNRVDPVGAPSRSDAHALLPIGGPEVPSDPRNGDRAAPNVTRGRVHLSWSEPPLVRARPADTEGVRLSSWSGLGGSADLELVGRRPGFLHVRARTKAGSLLDGWIEESTVAVGGGGGRGAGIGLCGCGLAGHAGGASVMTIGANAAIHAEPDGPAWSHASAAVAALVAKDDGSGWRRVLHVDGLSEGGDACDSGRLEHAWVRASDVTAR